MNAQVADETALLEAGEAAKAIDSRSNMVYIDADAFIGNPYALLGSVIEIRKVDGKCPANINDALIEFSPYSIQGWEIDETSKIKEPIKRQSIMIDQSLSLEIGVLAYLSTQLKNDASFSIMVFDQAAGVINRQLKSWNDGVEAWKTANKELLADPEICYIYAVIGFVQKYVIRKKYTKFDVKAKGGAFGVNLNGQLYTSSEDYSLDVRYGLQPVILKRPGGKGLEAIVSDPSRNDFDVLKNIALSGKAKVRSLL